MTYVDGATLAMQRPDHIRSADGLALAHFDDSANVAQKMLQEKLQVEACFLVDRGGDALDATATGQAADGRFGDALDVVAENFLGSGSVVSRARMSRSSMRRDAMCNVRSLTCVFSIRLYQGLCRQARRGHGRHFCLCRRRRP